MFLLPILILACYSPSLAFLMMCLAYRLNKQSGLYLIFAGCSVPQSCLALCNPMDYGTPGFPVLHHLPEFAQTCVHWVGDAIQPSHPLLSHSLPAFKFSQHQSPFQWVGSSHQVAEILNFSFTISLFNEYSELISFQIDWFDLAIQGTLKSLLQHHSSKPLILWCSALFMLQLSYPYMTTGKTIAWHYGLLLAKWCLCFLIHCLGSS